MLACARTGHTFTALYREARRATQGFAMCGLPVDTLGADLQDQHVPWGALLGGLPRGGARPTSATLGHSHCLRGHPGPPYACPPCGFEHPAGQPHSPLLCTSCAFSLTLTLPWAQAMDGDILAWLQECLALPFPALCRDTILRTPLVLGGLPLLILADESVLHFLLGHLAPHVVLILPLTLTSSLPWTWQCVALLTWGPRSVPLPHRRPAHYRRAFHDALLLRMHRACPWLVPPAVDAQALRAGITPRFQCRALLAWFPARGEYLMHAAPLRYAVASHCRTPLLPAGGRCHYATHSHQERKRHININKFFR